MTTPKTILVATDFEPESQAALRVASELARCCDAKLHAVHALHLHANQNLAAVPLAIELEAEKNAQRRLLAATAEVANLGELMVRTGEPADVILEAAKQLHADLVVLGAHKRRGLSHLLLGSVSETVTRRSPCSVLVHVEPAPS